MRRLLAILFIACAVLLSSGHVAPQPTSAHPAAHVIHGYGLYYITYYYPTGYRTSSGWPAVWGEVATDLGVIPSGAYVKIQGITRIFRARDTGGAVWGRHIDVLVYSYAQGQAVSGPTQHRIAYWWYGPGP